MKAIWTLLKETLSQWSEDRAPSLAAALAYYAIFALAPLLIIAIAIASVFFERSAVQGQLLVHIRDSMGPGAATAVQQMIAHASKPSSSIIATVTGVAALLLGASGVFLQLQSSLNVIWDVPARPGGGLKRMIRQRLVYFAMVVGMGFLLLASLVVSTALAGLSHEIGSAVPGADQFWRAVDFLVSFGVVTVLFALVFKLLPQTEVAWGDVWIGAIVTALLFDIGKLLVGVYIGRSSISSAYGAAGSLVILLVWIYYSAQLLFLGAEFTEVYARLHGSKRDRRGPTED